VVPHSTGRWQPVFESNTLSLSPMFYPSISCYCTVDCSHNTWKLKGQLDATDWFLYCKTYCSLNMFQAPLCPSSGAQELYRWLLLVVPGALVYRLLVWCGHITHSSTPDQRPVNQSAWYHRQQPSV